MAFISGNHKEELLLGGTSRPCVCCLAPSPVHLDALLPLLNRYPNHEAALILQDGFSNGFSVGFEGHRVGMSSTNLQSARANLEVALDKIKKEVTLGRIAGPFTTPPLQNLRVSPIGLVPKSSGNAFRLIHHLSWPAGNSLNDGIRESECRVNYTRFDDAVQCIALAGTSTLMAKADIKSAFRLLPIKPGDFDLLGMKVGGYFFVDKCLPMGAASAPALFEIFSTFIEWATTDHAKCGRILHYCDDFLAYGGHGEGHESCMHMLKSFQEICQNLGVPLADEKTEGPTPVITFLGLEIDAARQVIRIPDNKLVKLRAVVDSALSAKKLTLKNLQSIIGSLQFVSKAVPPGRAFLRRLINLTVGLRHPSHRVRINNESKEDLRMWSKFLSSCNGATIIPDQVWSCNGDLQLFTDASGSIGFAGYFQGQWFQGRWPDSILVLSPSIAWMEFFPIMVAVSVWGRELAGKRVMFRTDNQSVVAILNKQSSQCKRIMRLVRHFVLTCLKWNVTFRATHIPGIINEIADSLSRFQDSRFRHLAPMAAIRGVEIPATLWEV